MTRAAVAIIDADGNLTGDTETVLPVYSIAKTFIAHLIVEADIDLDAPVSEWLDPALVPRGADITVVQLLNHTSGLGDYGGLALYHDAVQAGDAPWTDDEFAARTLTQPLLFEPGTSFAYSNPGYWLLVQILEEVSGRTLDELVAELGCAMGLSSTRVAHGQFAEDLPHYPAEWVWHGVILATAADVARFMASDAVMRLMEPAVPVSPAPPPWANPQYGLGLMLEPGIMYGHNGSGPGYSASAFHLKRSGVTACVLSPGHAEDAAFVELLDLTAAYR